MSKTHEKIEINGRKMWRMTEVGPRGGKRRYYAPVLRADEAEPSAWVIWSERARDVGHDVVARI